MQNTLTPFTRWHWLTAAGVEGFSVLAMLGVHLVESLFLMAALTEPTPARYGLAVVMAVAGGALVAPLRLGVWRWYSRAQACPGKIPSPLWVWTGYGRPLAAVGWRWAVWWRQTGLFLVAAVPAALLWSYGDRLARAGEGELSVMYLLTGAVALLGAVAVTVLRRCRYALAPLLLERGYSAPLAVQVSLRLTRRRTGEWVNFWGDRAGWLCLCLVPGGVLWALPRLRRAYRALLTEWLTVPAEATRKLAL